jgi:hypothetical protein
MRKATFVELKHFPNTRLADRKKGEKRRKNKVARKQINKLTN